MSVSVLNVLLFWGFCSAPLLVSGQSPHAKIFESEGAVQVEAPMGTLVVQNISFDQLKADTLDIKSSLEFLKETIGADICSTIHACSESYDTRICGARAVKCEKTTAGGNTQPWTLAARFSNDGNHTWTWNNRGLWKNNERVGTGFGTFDFKGESFFLPANDMLFVADTGDWMSYNGYLAERSIQKLMQNTDRCLQANSNSNENKCLERNSFEVTAFSLPTKLDDARLCVKNVFVHPRDYDVSDEKQREHTYGFAWSMTRTEGKRNGCPLDDVGVRGSLGPSSSDRTLSFGQQLVSHPAKESLSKGFMAANVANYMELYVR